MTTLHTVDGEVQVPDVLPVIALCDVVFFPYAVVPLKIGRAPSLAALADAAANGGLVLLVTQRDREVTEPRRSDLYDVGAVIRVVETVHAPKRPPTVTMEGLGRARMLDYAQHGDGYRARVELLTEHETDRQVDASLSLRLARRKQNVLDLYRRYMRMQRHPGHFVRTVTAARDWVQKSHLIAAHLAVGIQERQQLLETVGLVPRLKALHDILQREVEVLGIHEKLDRQMGLDLGGRAGPGPGRGRDAARPAIDPEWLALQSVIEATPLSEEARDRVDNEFRRLCRLNPAAPEASVIHTYLDWILALPWQHETRDRLDLERAQAVLDREHYGLDEVKDRIVDHLAVLARVERMQGPILCLVGPPGVGKTSLGRSIAACLGRRFVRVSLGGVRDEAEIRGHRRTYVAALPGRVLQGMRRSGSRNPVFLLDEVDKLARDFNGDPGAALLEVLDPEQNSTFTDHYLEIEFDLSSTLFLATANTLSGVPGPLRDRMEVIRLSGYLDTEKQVIAQRFLWPRQVEMHGLTDLAPSVSQAAVQTIIAEYTREAGVRQMERRLSRVARKLARRLAEPQPDDVSLVDVEEVRAMLGPPTHMPPRREESVHRAGIACGLAWTAAGGEVLEVEAAVVPGTGQLKLTGTLGEVMKESAHAALTYARSRALTLGLDERFHEEVDIHIHIPEGATPKDGPSAGITIAVALVSALTDTPTRADLAMTGEITLRGRVLVVGGIKEKAVAALRGGCSRMLLPAMNAMDIERLPAEVLDGVELVPVESMDQVLHEALATRMRRPHAPVGASDPPKIN